MSSNVSILKGVKESNVQDEKREVVNAVKAELENMHRRMAELIVLLEKLDMWKRQDGLMLN